MRWCRTYLLPHTLGLMLRHFSSSSALAFAPPAIRTASAAAFPQTTRRPLAPRCIGSPGPGRPCETLQVGRGLAAHGFGAQHNLVRGNVLSGVWSSRSRHLLSLHVSAGQSDTSEAPPSQDQVDSSSPETAQVGAAGTRKGLDGRDSHGRDSQDGRGFPENGGASDVSAEEDGFQGKVGTAGTRKGFSIAHILQLPAELPSGKEVEAVSEKLLREITEEGMGLALALHLCFGERYPSISAARNALRRGTVLTPAMSLLAVTARAHGGEVVLVQERSQPGGAPVGEQPFEMEVHTLSLSHSLSRTHTRSLAHTLTHTHSLTLSHTHTLSHTLSLSHTPSLSHTLSHTHSHTHSLSHTLSLGLSQIHMPPALHSLSHTHPHNLSLSL